MKTIKVKFNYLTLYFLLVACLCGYIKYALYSLIIVCFHEIGHIFITLILGYNITSVEILPFGGITKIDKPLNTPIIHDLLISCFGIFFQFVFIVLGNLNLITDNVFLKINIIILLFNIMPIIPLDGSKIMMEIYNIFFSFKKSLLLYYLTSLLFIIIYGIFGYKYFLNNYLIIVLFVFKTFEVIKMHKLIENKFVLERILYDNLHFTKIKNVNEDIGNYQKDRQYYYVIDNKIMSDKEYLKKFYFNYF